MFLFVQLVISFTAESSLISHYSLLEPTDARIAVNTVPRLQARRSGVQTLINMYMN